MKLYFCALVSMCMISGERVFHVYELEIHRHVKIKIKCVYKRSF